VESTTRSRRPQPRSNTKDDKISSASISYQNLFMVRRLRLFLAYDGEFKATHQLRLEVYRNWKKQEETSQTKTCSKFSEYVTFLHMDLCGPMRVESINGKWALCYPKNYREDIWKLGAKGDIEFFIGYSTTSCAYTVYNRRTKKVMEMMNVTSDELSAMDFEQLSGQLSDATRNAPAAPCDDNTFINPFATPSTSSTESSSHYVDPSWRRRQKLLLTPSGLKCDGITISDKEKLMEDSAGGKREDNPRRKFAGLFHPNIARPLHGVKLLGRYVSLDFDFGSEVVMRRVAKSIELMDVVFERAQRYGLALERSFDIVTTDHIFIRISFAIAKRVGTDLLSNPSEIAASKLMKKMIDIYFTRVTKNAKSTFSLSPRQMALWTSQREDHTSDWLRTVLIFRLGQTMNASSRVSAEDIYGDHAVSCAGIIGIEHRHNVVRDTLVDICYCSGISAGLNVCMDLTGSSPLTQTGIVDFVPGRAMIDAAQRKRGKYMAKCAAIGYGFLSFLSLL
ncbi:hypothetical protein Tco_0257647, partial [Tanacetum coccineum]